MKKLLAIILALSLALTFAACSTSEDAQPAAASSEEAAEPATEEASGEPIVLKVGTVIAGDTSPVLMAFAAMKEELDATGRFDVQIFPASQLGNAGDITDQCRSNDIQVATVHTPSVSATLTDLAILEQFYLFDSMDHAFSFYGSEGGAMLLEAYKEMGLVGLGYMPIGARELSNSKLSVVNPEDFDGLKIRGYNAIQIAAWESIGCSLSSVEWNELFTSMQQKLIDGQETSIVNFNNEKFYEVQPYVSLTGHQIAADVLVVNEGFYNSLSADDKALFDAAMANVIAMQNEEVVSQTASLSEKLETEDGVTINELPEETMQFMKDNMIPASQEQILAMMDQAVYDEVMEYVEAAR